MRRKDPAVRVGAQSVNKGRLRSRPEFGLGVLGLGFGAVPAAQGEVK